MSRNTLAVCQVYDKGLHGVDEEACGHHLAIFACEKDETPLGFLEFWQPGDFLGKWEVNNFVKQAQSQMENRIQLSENPYICQKEIARFPRVDIVEKYELSSGHIVAIRKTIWLSILQRKWRKYLQESKTLVKHKRQRFN